MATTSTAAPAASTNLTDGFHMLVQSLLKNDLNRMYGVIGIPVTDVARIAQA